LEFQGCFIDEKARAGQRNEILYNKLVTTKQMKESFSNAVLICESFKADGDARRPDGWRGDLNGSIMESCPDLEVTL
jgi:hypothetical protein